MNNANQAAAQLQSFYTILDALIDDVTQNPIGRSISQDFINQILPYHRAAIDIAASLLEYTDYMPARDIAMQIISQQTDLITALQRIEEECAEQRSSRLQTQQYQQEVWMLLANILLEMVDAPTGQRIECNFINQMLPQQRGAVRLAQAALNRAICQPLVPLLQSAITAQQNTIRQLETLAAVSDCAE